MNDTTTNSTNPTYLNNLAFVQIRQGEYQNAISTLSLSLPALRDQATIVSAAAASTAATQASSQSDPTAAAAAAAAFPATTTTSHSSLNQIVYRVYKGFEILTNKANSNTLTYIPSICNQPLKLPDQPTTLDGYYYEFMSATILFNLGLAYHLIALSLLDKITTSDEEMKQQQQQQQEQQQQYEERSKTFFIKASRIYEFAYTLVCNSSNETIRNSLLFTTIMHNNMGLLYHQLQDTTRRDQCFDHLLLMLMSNAQEVITTNTMSITSSSSNGGGGTFQHAAMNATTIIPPQYLLDIFFQNIYTYTTQYIGDGELLLNRHFIAAPAA